MSDYKITVSRPRDNGIGARIWDLKHNGYFWGYITRHFEGAFYWVKVDGTPATGHKTFKEARQTAIARLENYLDEYNG